MEGRVLWFNWKKGQFGYIKGEDSSEIFFHITDILNLSDYDNTIYPGDKVKYVIEDVSEQQDFSMVRAINIEILPRYENSKPILKVAFLSIEKNLSASMVNIYITNKFTHGARYINLVNNLLIATSARLSTDKANHLYDIIKNKKDSSSFLYTIHYI